MNESINMQRQTIQPDSIALNASNLNTNSPNQPFTSSASATNRSLAPSDRGDKKAGPMGWAERLTASSGSGPDGAYWAMNVSNRGVCGPLFGLSSIYA